MKLDLVLDTNVFVCGLISRRGAAFRLLEMAGSGRFDLHLSVPLVLEYEDVAKRLSGNDIQLSEQQIDDVIDYLCTIANHHRVHYLWRPFLPDAYDDMVLELAVAGRCDYIVTYNESDFEGIEQFGVRATRPQVIVDILRETQ